MKRSMLILIILASLIPGILAVVQYVENNKKEIEGKKNEEALNSKIDSLKIDNSDLKRQLKTLSKDNADLSHQLAETALKLNENVIGSGDLQVELNTSNTGNFNFRFVNSSELVVNNANILVQNYNEIMKCEILKENDTQVHIKGDCYQNKHSRISGLNFNPYGAFVDTENSHSFTNDYMNYAIRISTRKKIIFYHLVYKIVDNTIKRSYRIYNLVNDKMHFVKEQNDLHLTQDFWSKNFYTKILYVD